MKYLDYLTKEELIDVMQKVFSEDKLYELVYEALDKRWYLLRKKSKETAEKANTLIVTEHQEYPYSEEVRELRALRDRLSKEYSEVAELQKEVGFMQKHRKYNKHDNRSYEELKAEEDERIKKEIAQLIEEYEAQLEKKYG